MTSRRLPGKVLLPLAGRPVLEHLILRACHVWGSANVVVLVPHGPDQDPLWEYLRTAGLCAALRGPEQDVWARYVGLVGEWGLQPTDWVVRLTADCPWIPLEVLADAGDATASTTHNVRSNSCNAPPGWNMQAVTVQTLLRLPLDERYTMAQREHVISFLDRRMEPIPDWLVRLPEHFRCTLDTPADYAWMQRVARLIDVTPPLHPTLDEWVRFCADYPEDAIAPHPVTP